MSFQNVSFSSAKIRTLSGVYTDRPTYDDDDDAILHFLLFCVPFLCDSTDCIILHTPLFKVHSTERINCEVNKMGHSLLS